MKVEALGEATEGGLMAPAVEPRADKDQGRTHEDACLNCGAALAGAYCHRCGQHAHVHRTIRAFLHDLLHGVLHLEGKTWRTLRMLAWRPGELTRRYIEGERAKFVSPVATFLFSVFLMFAAFSLTGAMSMELRNTRAEVAAALRHARADEAELKQRAAGAAFGIAVRDSQAELRPLPQRLDAATRAVGMLEEAEQSIIVALGVGPRARLPYLPRVEKGLNKFYENPTLAVYKLQSNAYKYSWTLIPLSVPFVALLFLWRRRYQCAYDHTVFVTYSLTFMTLLVVTLSLLRSLGVPQAATVLILLLVPPAHMFMQLRGAYELSALSALWRTIALASFAIVVGALFMLLALLLGVLN